MVEREIQVQKINKWRKFGRRGERKGAMGLKKREKGGYGFVVEERRVRN